MCHHEEQDPVSLMEKMVWASRICAYIMSFYGLVQGFVIVVGGANRFSAVGYATAMQVPGAPPSWGWFLIGCSLVCIIGIRTANWRLASLGMWLSGLWSMFFATAFAISALRDPHANLTAMVAYGKDAILFILIAVIYRNRVKGDRRA